MGTFFDFLRGTLVPNMQLFDGSNSNSILIMDNCSIHHIDIAKDLLLDAGILLIYLPPYSPDFNPVEQVFSCVKYYLKCHDEILQTAPDPCFMSILQAAFDNVTETDCGYN